MENEAQAGGRGVRGDSVGDNAPVVSSSSAHHRGGGRGRSGNQQEPRRRGRNNQGYHARRDYQQEFEGDRAARYSSPREPVRDNDGTRNDGTRNDGASSWRDSPQRGAEGGSGGRPSHYQNHRDSNNPRSRGGNGRGVRGGRGGRGGSGYYVNQRLTGLMEVNTEVQNNIGGGGGGLNDHGDHFSHFNSNRDRRGGTGSREGGNYHHHHRQNRDDEREERGGDNSDRNRNRRHNRGYRGRHQDGTPESSNTTSVLNPNAPPFHFQNQPNNNTVREEREYNYNSREGSVQSEGGAAGGAGTRRKAEFVSNNQGNDKPRNQREVLIDQLNRNNHECMVCCEKVRYSQPIWSCLRCFNIFHLSCIRKWASKSVDSSDQDSSSSTGWRCPSCQSCHDDPPNGYYCFCGKTKNPKSSRHDVPHTCGQVCGKTKPGGVNCTHSCISQCHPGPCPSCEVQQVRYCGCGKTNARVLCGSKAVLNCDSVCDKLLNCGVHRCFTKCHQGECEPCKQTVKHECYCGRSTRQVDCTANSNRCKFYSCQNPCEKPLTCGHHLCSETCHSGACSTCKTSPESVISCPCGQTPISEACKMAKLPQRKRCTDPIPTCGKTCKKILSCGGGGDGSNNYHVCQEKCHLNKECPPCKLVSSVKCRCGTKTLEVPCKQLKSQNDITCGKKCNKKRSCGKHKCSQTCCIDTDHICPIVCQRPLRCGNHKCTSLCHLNPCAPCEHVSFDELSCECGASIIYPPVPCGTKRPPCQRPCSRTHQCNHAVHHPCHSEENCPPCTVLTEKWCHGAHEKRKNVMCHISSLSCGMPCNKPLMCGRHKCPKICHPGVCLEPGEICRLPCTKPRACGHQCGNPCHEDQCPESKCKISTEVTCPCGRRSDTLVCWKRENEYDRTVTWEYHKEVKKLEEEAAKSGQKEFTISEEEKENIMASFKEKIAKSQVLECDKECAKLERNRKLAEALQIDNADPGTTSIGTPNYSDFLTKFAKKNPQFVETVHKQLTELVMKAKQSTKKNLTYAFNSMNRDKRHVIHEYSDHFGILSESFDEEPNRNVVCFASKEKSYLPTVSLIDAVFRPLAVRSERLKPHDDVTFRAEKRTQVVGPSNWGMPKSNNSSSSSQSNQMVTLNIPGTSAGSSDFPPL